jgi:CRP/FNR family transcriptional regulator, dissimilatory nitrate respiration regulator
VDKLKPDVRGLIGRLPLFSALDLEAVSQLADATSEHQLNRGDVLFQQGDPCRGVFVVVHGQVKLAVTAPNGNEKVVEIISGQMSFGEAVMFLDRPFPVFAQALTDTLVLSIPREPVLALIDENPMFARRMLAGLSVRLHSLVKDVEAYSLRSSTQRLIGYLLREAGDDESPTRTVEIDLPTSKQVLASRLSVTPETFSRILHSLSESGLIEVQGKTIRIADVMRLRDYEP